MIVMLLEKVPLRVRGELTRWLIEPHTGVFVGHVNAMVRERLWIKCSQARGIFRGFVHEVLDVIELSVVPHLFFDAVVKRYQELSSLPGQRQCA